MERTTGSAKRQEDFPSAPNCSRNDETESPRPHREIDRVDGDSLSSSSLGTVCSGNETVPDAEDPQDASDSRPRRPTSVLSNAGMYISSIFTSSGKLATETSEGATTGSKQTECTTNARQARTLRPTERTADSVAFTAGVGALAGATIWTAGVAVSEYGPQICQAISNASSAAWSGWDAGDLQTIRTQYGWS
ncbi:hypothetical protein I316_07159 [Kwoniella heveanensis BCC8398]|uniref:Uncharacterized protein n=1 Tax=Kwoniella heveanensis BCC8398 TaxID=1296120 RepID=A0A1B9GJL5_9TREE|nr:hypothetical protein I316_07159 [Kwoniella heveanensis BCC8398]